MEDTVLILQKDNFLASQVVNDQFIIRDREEREREYHTVSPNTLSSIAKHISNHLFTTCTYNAYQAWSFIIFFRSI